MVHSMVHLVWYTLYGTPCMVHLVWYTVWVEYSVLCELRYHSGPSVRVKIFHFSRNIHAYAIVHVCCY